MLRRISTHFRGSHKLMIVLYWIIILLNHVQVESIAILLEYYEEKINPIHQDWLDVLDMVLESYLQDEKRAGVRVKTLDVLTRIYQRYRHGYYEVRLFWSAIFKNITVKKYDIFIFILNNACKALLSNALIY